MKDVSCEASFLIFGNGSLMSWTYKETLFVSLIGKILIKTASEMKKDL